LSACLSGWRAQRGPAGIPAAPDLAEVTVLTALALHHIPPSEVTDLLTDRVASAASLPSVLTWRLGRVLAAARRRLQVPADEDGRRHAAMLAARAHHPPPPAWHHARAALSRRRPTHGPLR